MHKGMVDAEMLAGRVPESVPDKVADKVPDKVPDMVPDKAPDMAEATAECKSLSIQVKKDPPLLIPGSWMAGLFYGMTKSWK